MSNEVLKTIKGVADFCYVTSPDVGFGSNQYKVTLRVNTKDASEHIEVLQKIISKEHLISQHH